MIYLDDAFFDNPKVIAAGDQAIIVYLKGLAWLKQQRSTDGRIPKAVLPRLAPVVKGRHVPAGPLAEQLVNVVLWHDEQTHWSCHDYVVKNARALTKSKQASDAARTRWTKEAERLHSGRNSTRNADADADADRTHMQQSTVHSPQSTVPISLPKSRSSHLGAAANGSPKAGPAKAEPQPPDHGPDGWGNPEHTGPDETPDDRNRRRSMAIRWHDTLQATNPKPIGILACNQAVAQALHIADWRIIDEQIGWQADATDPPRTPQALVAAVRRVTSQ